MDKGGKEGEASQKPETDRVGKEHGRDVVSKEIFLLCVTHNIFRSRTIKSNADKVLNYSSGGGKRLR